MNKPEFLSALREGLAGLPRQDVAERLAFYDEMIDDRMEDGLTEEEAVAGIGPADRVAAQIIAETPIAKLVRERVKPDRRLRTWEIVLLVLGAPVWIPLVIAGLAVVFSVYAVLWALVVSLWAVEASFIAGAAAGLAAGIVKLCLGDKWQGLSLMAAGLVLAGLSIILFFACKAATKGALRGTKAIAAGIKSLLLRKEKTE